MYIKNCLRVCKAKPVEGSVCFSRTIIAPTVVHCSFSGNYTKKWASDCLNLPLPLSPSLRLSLSLPLSLSLSSSKKRKAPCGWKFPLCLHSGYFHWSKIDADILDISVFLAVSSRHGWWDTKLWGLEANCRNHPFWGNGKNICQL